MDKSSILKGIDQSFCACGGVDGRDGERATAKVSPLNTDKIESALPAFHAALSNPNAHIPTHIVMKLFAFLTDCRESHATHLQAEQALAVKPDGSEAAVIARAVALRNKGLILRDLYRDLGIAIKSHEEAVKLLKKFQGSTMAQLEMVLNLAE